jgi:diadenylate cyclase
MILLKGTKAVKIFYGLSALFLVSLVSTSIGLYTFDWVLQSLLANIIVVLVVLFQPEIRRALARVGDVSFWHSRTSHIAFEPAKKIIGKTPFSASSIPKAVDLKSLEEIIVAVARLASNKTGALFVLQRETSVEDFIEVGTVLNASISATLLLSIFHTSSPIHDGAVIIKNNQLFAAGCFLPLSSRTDLPRSYGTRHKAGIGLAEETDAAIIIVSEETGGITFVVGNRLEKNITTGSLRTMLVNIFVSHKK